MHGCWQTAQPHQLSPTYLHLGRCSRGQRVCSVGNQVFRFNPGRSTISMALDMEAELGIKQDKLTLVDKGSPEALVFDLVRFTVTVQVRPGGSVREPDGHCSGAQLGAVVPPSA
eukprot:SAG22_NODE_23_length_31399_cov_35.631313_5_plen_114_part_00